MRIIRPGLIRHGLLALIVLAAAVGCSSKQETRGGGLVGEKARAGAKLAYEHRLRIKLPNEQIAPRIAAVREACESARFGDCNVLRIGQDQRGGELSLRVVPSGVEPLSSLAGKDGKLVQRWTQAEDLADAVQDNEQKLKQLDAYAAQIDQLALRKDLSASDLIALGHERAQNQVQREALQNIAVQQQRRLDTNLLQLDFVDTSRGWHFGDLLDGWTDQLYEGIAFVLTAVAYGIPFVLLAFPFALAWRALWRRFTRKSRERASA